MHFGKGLHLVQQEIRVAHRIVGGQILYVTCQLGIQHGWEDTYPSLILLLSGPFTLYPLPFQ